MRIILSFILFSITFYSFAQKKDTVFADIDGNICERWEAVTYRLIKKEGQRYIIKEYILYTDMLWRSCNVEGTNLNFKNGHVTYYDDNGCIVSSGNYKKNKFDGPWTIWEDYESDTTVLKLQPNEEAFILNKGHYTLLEGKKQYVNIEGKAENKPTIVFLTGKGRLQHDFRNVYNVIKKTNRIFSYDRAGIGQSEPLNHKRTVDTMAYELHELLMLERIEPPYILVGHSMGGHIMRCFVNMYPDKVAGLIFIDPSIPFTAADITTNKSDRTAYQNEYRGFSSNLRKTKGEDAESKYCFDYDNEGYCTNHKLVKDLKLPKNIPVTYMISTKEDVFSSYGKNEINYKLKLFRAMKETDLSVKVLFDADIGHYIHIEQPKVVIDEINEIINKVNSK